MKKFTLYEYKDIHDLEEIYCSIINPKFIDYKTTISINECINSNATLLLNFNLNNNKFQNIINSYNNLITTTNNIKKTSIYSSDPSLIFENYSFLQKDNYISIDLFNDNYIFKFTFIIYPSTILIFINHNNKKENKSPVFLCAVFPDAIQLDFSTIDHEIKVIVEEKKI
mgnify:CR=1 FL=1